MEGASAAVREHPEGSLIALRVRPSASRRAVEGLVGEAIAVSVHSPPEKGRANKEVLQVLSAALGIPPSCLQVIKGVSSRSKTVLARGITPSEACTRLGLQLR